WDGPALADLRGFPFGAAEGQRLDEFQLELTVCRLRAELESGMPVVDELRRLGREYPVDEAAGCLLALALYRTGRQAEAITVLSSLRENLAAELGVRPRASTVELEVQILRQDPGLLPPSLPVARTASVPTATELPFVPGSASSLVGRDDELEQLLSRVAEPVLLTLVGVAGSGKSRLAVEVVRAIANRPTFFVELAPLRGDGSVAAAVAGVTGADWEDGRPLGAIAEKADGSVLVIDNAEHLVDQVSDVVSGLRGLAPDLTVLVTSQRPLQLSDEELYPVDPLPMEAAVCLFTERAAPGSVRADEAPDVLAICTAVDGLPLGVELAAGLTRTLTVPQLASRITDRLRLQMAGRRDGGARHATLRAALDWGYELLDPQEQAVLRRVGVFAGGFELEAAEYVVPRGVVAAVDVAPVLVNLVDRSLVTVVADGNDGRRFALLETVRDYALTQLEATDEGDTARSRQLGWCLAHTKELTRRGQAMSFDTIGSIFAEWPNLRAALEFAPGTPYVADGLRLMLALKVAFAGRRWFREGRRHFAALIDAPGVEPAERAEALCRSASYAVEMGDHADAAELLGRAADIAAAVGDAELDLTVRFYQGRNEVHRGRVTNAIAIFRAGEEEARNLGLESRAASFYSALGAALGMAGDAQGALDLLTKDLEYLRREGQEAWFAIALHDIAAALADLGRTDEALQTLDESDSYAHRLEDRDSLPRNQILRAAVARRLDELDEAEALLRDALTYPEVTSDVYLDLAEVLIAKGETTEAKTHLDKAYASTYEGGVMWLAARAVSAAMALALGEPGEARKLAEETAILYADVGFGQVPYVALLSKVRTSD
ncbi:hypothetical protein E1261_37080, partial [Kribbella albertanoniae]